MRELIQKYTFPLCCLLLGFNGITELSKLFVQKLRPDQHINFEYTWKLMANAVPKNPHPLLMLLFNIYSFFLGLIDQLDFNSVGQFNSALLVSTACLLFWYANKKNGVLSGFIFSFMLLSSQYVTIQAQMLTPVCLVLPLLTLSLVCDCTLVAGVIGTSLLVNDPFALLIILPVILLSIKKEDMSTSSLTKMALPFVLILYPLYIGRYINSAESVSESDQLTFPIMTLKRRIFECFKLNSPDEIVRLVSTMTRVLQHNCHYLVLTFAALGVLVNIRNKPKVAISRILVPILTLVLFNQDIHLTGLLIGPTLIIIYLFAIDFISMVESYFTTKLATLTDNNFPISSILVISLVAAIYPKESFFTTIYLKKLKFSNIFQKILKDFIRIFQKKLKLNI